MDATSHRPLRVELYATSQVRRYIKLEVKICSYLALYPIRWTTQGVLHFLPPPPDRPVHSDTNSASLGSIQTRSYCTNTILRIYVIVNTSLISRGTRISSCFTLIYFSREIFFQNVYMWITILVSHINANPAVTWTNIDEGSSWSNKPFTIAPPFTNITRIMIIQQLIVLIPPCICC